MARRLVPARALAASVATAVLLLAATACGATTATTTASTSSSGSTCSSFGITWARSYNAKATKTGNPVRIISACCTHSATAGVQGCFITVTLAGTKDRGCEYVKLDAKGTLAGPGEHRACPAKTPAGSVVSPV